MGKVMKVMKAKVVTAPTMKPTKKRTGFIQKKAERGQGLKFKLETYATVSKFKPGTMIKYGPNPKSLGSKSHTRYAKYENAKTVGESLKAGAKVADFLWELERGHYKVLGTERSEKAEISAIGNAWYKKCDHAFRSFIGPHGLNRSFDDPKACEALKKEDEWRNIRLKKCEALAKQMGMKVETAEELEKTGESSADIRLQRRVADAVSLRKLESGKPISYSDLEEVLMLWGFNQNTGRKNVLPDGVTYVYSDSIGALRRRTGVCGITPPTCKYPHFTRLLTKWLESNVPNTGSKYVCSSVNLNANYAGARHRDVNNEGPSVIRAFGKFNGGKLRYWRGDTQKNPRPKVKTLKKDSSTAFDLKKETLVFDGNKAHEVEDFTGERYSVVYFTTKGYNKIARQDQTKLEKLGFPWPTSQSLAKLKSAKF